jgi:hypothetical protein
MEGKSVLGYVVVGVSPNNRRGYILDCGETGSRAIAEILRYIIEARHYDMLSIYTFCLNDVLRETLRGLHFKTKGLARILERRVQGELPLLIRPVKEKHTEHDFYVGEMDMRKIENWSLKPICSDAV